ncbi:uncharacterized protein LOC144116224 [Amblyomma americanum]
MVATLTKSKLDRQLAVLSKIAAEVICEAQSADTVAPDDMPIYPVKTQEELDILEPSTKDAATFATLVKTLGQIGGTDIRGTTRRVFRSLVSDDIAVQYNWTERKGNKRAGKLAIIRLVFAAVRVTRSAIDDEMARALADWLRFSNSRLTAAKASNSLTFACILMWQYKAAVFRSKHVVMLTGRNSLEYSYMGQFFRFLQAPGMQISPGIFFSQEKLLCICRVITENHELKAI